MERILFIGLGNPGEKYVSTYHNAGREILKFFKEKLEEKYGHSPIKEGNGFHFQKYGEFRLIYPDTFMNLSGEAAKSAIKNLGGGITRVIVFHDDSDLALGEYKMTSLLESSDAGHHGVSSVVSHLRTYIESMPPESKPNLARVRIGIRDLQEKNGDRPRRKAGEFVLRKISSKDQDILKMTFEKIAAELI